MPRPKRERRPKVVFEPPTDAPRPRRKAPASAPPSVPPSVGPRLFLQHLLFRVFGTLSATPRPMLAAYTASTPCEESIFRELFQTVLQLRGAKLVASFASLVEFMAHCDVPRGLVVRVHGDGQDENDAIVWMSPPIVFSFRRATHVNYDLESREQVTVWGDVLTLRYRIDRAATTEHALARIAGAPPARAAPHAAASRTCACAAAAPPFAPKASCAHAQ